MTILGTNAIHGDASACLIRDGEMIAAAEEERFRSIKYWVGFRSQAIAWCLEQAGVTLGQIDHTVLDQDAKTHLGRKRGLFHALQRGSAETVCSARLVAVMLLGDRGTR